MYLSEFFKNSLQSHTKTKQIIYAKVLLNVSNQRNNNNNNKSTIRAVRCLTKRYRNNENKTENEILDLLNQKLIVLCSRLKRNYGESVRRQQQNKQFLYNQNEFYRRNNTMNHSRRCTGAVGSERAYANSISHFVKAPWIEDEQKKHQRIDRITPLEIDMENARRAAAETASWNAPGADNVQNFCIRNIPIHIERN